MIAVGNDELGVEIPLGARVKCGRKHCHATHLIEYGKVNGVESRMLAFYCCKGHAYVCGVRGQLLPGEALADD
jgi:hypothetical protein